MSECPLGYPPDDLVERLGKDDAEAFLAWLGPVPPTICSAALSACSPPHGLVIGKGLIDDWLDEESFDEYGEVPEDYNDVVAERDALSRALIEAEREINRLVALLDGIGIEHRVAPPPEVAMVELDAQLRGIDVGAGDNPGEGSSPRAD